MKNMSVLINIMTSPQEVSLEKESLARRIPNVSAMPQGSWIAEDHFGFRAGAARAADRYQAAHRTQRAISRAGERVL
jgi:hypothetical protein